VHSTVWLLKYADALYEVDFTPNCATTAADLAEMRQARLAQNVSRNHQQPNKCAAWVAMM
jgi:hypothetical protein